MMRLPWVLLLTAAVFILTSASTELNLIEARDALDQRRLRSDDDGQERWALATFIHNLVSRVKALTSCIDKLKALVFAKEDLAAEVLAKLDKQYQTSWEKMSVDELVQDTDFLSWLQSLLQYRLEFSNAKTTALAYLQAKCKDYTILRLTDRLDGWLNLRSIREDLFEAWANQGLSVAMVAKTNVKWADAYEIKLKYDLADLKELSTRTTSFLETEALSIEKAIEGVKKLMKKGETDEDGL